MRRTANLPYCAVKPPSSRMSWPQIKSDAEEARYGNGMMLVVDSANAIVASTGAGAGET